MIELKDDRLVFSFPEVHKDAKLTIHFQRTLRIPDNANTYPLPPGLGAFPLRHVDDYSTNVPGDWADHGGVFMPMYQSEAMWISFQANYSNERNASYPFAVKIYTGKINAVTGERFVNGLNDDDQDYMVVPGQPWLDGYCIEKGTIRQFVAMPLGDGYTAEEQVTGEAEWGGIQVIVFPMKEAEYERRFPVRRADESRVKCMSIAGEFAMQAPGMAPAAMGLAPGGRMKQEIFSDNFGIKVWDKSERSRCFIHIANSIYWRAITGAKPPTKPPTAKEYSQHGLPWFDYYDDDLDAVDGAALLNKLKSIFAMRKRREVRSPDDDDDMRSPRLVVHKLGKERTKVGTVREGDFWEDSV